MNLFKTTFLLSLLTGLLLFVGHAVGGIHGMVVALAVAGLMNFISYFFSDSIVLAMYGASPADESSRLTRVVQDLSQKTGIPMPRVYTIPSAAPNALATGRNPSHAAVAATEGILEILDDDELQAVMAHELSHVRNRDILTSSIVATIAGAISLLANMLYYGAMLGGFSRSRDDNDSGALSMLVMVIFVPLIATLLQFAISRSREYAADATGASLTGQPLVLARALAKVHGGIQQAPMEATPARQATAHLFFANPFSARKMFALLSTHPPMEDRIARLEEMDAAMRSGALK